MKSKAPKKPVNLQALRKRLNILQTVIAVASINIIYEGIRMIRSQATTPVFFYVYLILFTGFMVFAFIFNLKRIRAIDKKLAEGEGKDDTTNGIDKGEDQQ